MHGQLGTHQTGIEIGFGANEITVHMTESDIGTTREFVRDPETDGDGPIFIRLTRVSDGRDSVEMVGGGAAMQPRTYVYQIPEGDVGRNHVVVI